MQSVFYFIVIVPGQTRWSASVEATGLESNLRNGSFASISRGHVGVGVEVLLLGAGPA